MSRLQVDLEPLPFPVLVHTTERTTRERYRAFCQANPNLRIEMTATGEIIVMPAAHSRTGEQNSEISMQLGIWARKDGRGVAFDSSAGFDLPNGSNRSPDAAWVLETRITVLPPLEQDGYLPLCPDFVIELRSRSDSLPGLKEKMQEYMENGARLGWLIDPVAQQVFVYLPGKEPEYMARPDRLSGEDVLPNFVLELERIWNPVVGRAHARPKQ